MSVIDEVKQKLDIVEVISQYATLKKAGRNMSALCPFHTEKNPSFYVYPEQQSWHCFGACNTGGDVFSFVMRKENIDFGEALRLLADRAGIAIPTRFEPETGKDEKERLFKVNEAAALYFHNLLLNSPEAKKASDYLERRGFSMETMSNFQLGFAANSWEALKEYLLEKDYSEEEILEAGLVIAADDGKTHDRFRNKLIIPIIDNRGRITGFGARVLDDSLPKYVNSPQTPVFDKSGTLYAINLAAPAIRQKEQAVIVEGYMDVITAHQSGFTNVIASMGTAVTEKQVNILKRLTKNFILALDADTAGEEAMLRCVDYEDMFNVEVKVAVLPEGKDPDDVIREDPAMWKKLLDDAIPVFDYTKKIVKSRVNMTTASGKANFVNSMLPYIVRDRDVTRQAHKISGLSDDSGISIPELKEALNQIKRPSTARQPVKKEAAPVKQPVFSRPVEEQCLALMLQHPELKNIEVGIIPDYFENSENREIYLAWQYAEDPEAVKESLDVALLEHIDNLINKSILATQLEERYNDIIGRLKEEYNRRLERKKAVVLASEAEVGGTAAALAKLEEQGIKESEELREIFTERAKRGRKKGDR
ncbi:DNA primase [Chloroflexota bacterium]